MKVFVAVPAYSGAVDVETVRALLNEQAAASASSIEISTAFLPGCSLITHARNQLCMDFLASDCDRLVFVDADVSWEVGSLIRLAKHPVHVVGGCYRAKEEPERYPFAPCDETGWMDPRTGLTPVRTLPGGFLAISRQALETLRKAFPGRAYSHYGRAYHGWFHAPIADATLYGEDSAFCTDWIRAGGVVWLDPTPRLTHTGGRSHFTGSVAEWAQRGSPTPDPASLS